MATSKNYVLPVLIVILGFTSADRLAVGLLIQDIKVELGLSDTQIGLLNGIGFALFYATMGVPIARWADRGNRVAIIALTSILWGVAMILSGLSRGFLQLAIIRVVVAVGEAGCVPPAHSLIADYFSRAERPRAVSRYMLGWPLSVVIGLFIAGWINEFWGWRITLACLGLPGLLLGVIAFFTIREPRRVGVSRLSLVESDNLSEAISDPSAALAVGSAQVPLRHLFRTLVSNVTFRRMLFSFLLLTFVGSSIGQWAPAYFVRRYGLTTGELGTWFAVTGGLCGVVGTILGGEWASRFATNNERRQLTAISLVYAVAAIAATMVFVSGSSTVAFMWWGVSGLCAGMTGGIFFANIQTLIPPDMRASAISIIYLASNLVGMGLGPLLVGIGSDALIPAFGDRSLQYVLLLFCPGYVWASYHMFTASRSIESDLRDVA